MKKIIVLLLAVMLMLPGMAACGSQQGESEESAGEALNVVTTIFPVYDWTRSIAGEDNESVNVRMLINSGVDLHSFQPTAQDILDVSECDVFIYVGGESDEWVEDALKEAVNEDMVVVNLMEAMGDRAKEEEVKEGMEAEHEHGEEPELDEHVWLSLKNAAFLSDTIADALGQADSANADAYKANAEAFKEKLNALDAEYQAAVDAASVDTLLFGDRFPFRYMTDDYGLDYFAAFVGCSAETEASFETIAFLSDKVDELGLHSVMTIETSDQSIAKSIINNTASKDQQILTIDSMQSTTSQDVDEGADYLSVMESNLEVLKEALK